jgi:hypothetical protein
MSLPCCCDANLQLQAEVAESQSRVRALRVQHEQAREQLEQFKSVRDQLDSQLQALAARTVTLESDVSAAERRSRNSDQVVEHLQSAEQALRYVSSLQNVDGQLAAVGDQLVAVRQDWLRRRDSSATQLAALRSQLLEHVALQNQRGSERASVVLKLDAAVQGVSTAGDALRQQQSLLQQKVAAVEAAGFESSQHCAESFLVAPLKPLTPEQMCWSVFKVTTVYDRYAAVERAALLKEAEAAGTEAADPEVLARETERRTFEKLKGYVTTWVNLYGTAAGQPPGDFYASADQALYMANGKSVLSWLAPAGDNAVERMLRATTPEAAAEELYLGILTRMPTESEVREITELFATDQDRSTVCQAIAWGLLNSAEFRFNH